ncbi:MAG TPA: helix-turn-helix domain-containing GNAT family N-acetyltransferase [Vicinamibacterales bacterium]
MSTGRPSTVPAATVDAVRAFNRFYTRRIGVLGGRLLETPYSLSEMRVLYELAHRGTASAAELRRDLGLDAGYLSRIVRRFEANGIVTRAAAPDDHRRHLLTLTARGRRAFAPLENRARSEVAAMTGQLAPGDQRELTTAMKTIERLLDPKAATPPPCVLRAHQPGDIGWVVHRHGELYAREWGYNEKFEALVARVAADFLDHFDPARERCWIAERDGVIVGSVFVVALSKHVAKLRMLLVEPSARGLGLGRRLVDECVRFARRAGYKKMTLWTHSELTAARRLYQDAGFVLTARKRDRSFGRSLVSETWELAL